MVYKRRRNSVFIFGNRRVRRRSYRRRSIQKRRLSRASTSHKALCRTVKQCINSVAEKKYGTVSPASWVAVGTGATITDYVAFPQGDIIDHREGNKVHLTSYSYLVNFSYNWVGAGTYYDQSYIRIIFFRWLPDSAIAAPVTSDLLEDTTTAADQMWSGYKLDPLLRSKFQILFDDRVLVGEPLTANNPAAAKGYVQKRYSGKLNDTLTYPSGGTTGKGHLYMCWFSHSIGTATESPGIKLQGKLHFTDI